MKFSMIFEAQMADTSPDNEQRVIRECVEQAVYAEEVGFDRIWAVEHHSLKWYAHMSAPEIFLTWVAARTTRIGIGHGVVCMPFGYNNPVRVAERAAMLDILSGGRVLLGAGRGATLQEMSLCGVDPDTTYAELEEALQIIGQAWQSDTFEWHGKLVDIAPHPLLPRPVQRPHPPLFLACTKHDTLALAAKYGIGALVLGFAGVDEIREMHRLYRLAVDARTGEDLVSTVINDHFAVLCPTITLDDAALAAKVGARGQRFFAESIAHWYGGGPPPEAHTDDEDNVEAMRVGRAQTIARLHEANIPVSPTTGASFYMPGNAYGDAPQAIRYVEQLIDAGAQEIMCLIQMGTVSQAHCMETIRQWGEHVIPHFRRLEASEIGAA